MNVRPPFASIMALCLVACASAPVGEPAAGESHDTARVPLSLGETRSGSEPLSWAMPSYPPTLQAACPAREAIDTAVYVGADGKVSNVVGIVVDRTLPPWDTFFAEVRSAVMQWRFAPLRVAHWAADAAGDAHSVDGEARPFLREYQFDFTCHAGKTNVSAKARGSADPR